MPAREVRRRPIAHHVIDELECLSLAHVHTDHDDVSAGIILKQRCHLLEALADPETVAFVARTRPPL
jgi:hypothetical protein